MSQQRGWPPPCLHGNNFLFAEPSLLRVVGESISWRVKMPGKKSSHTELVNSGSDCSPWLPPWGPKTNTHKLWSKRQFSPPSLRLDWVVPDTSCLSTWRFLECAVCIAESIPVIPRKWLGAAPTPVLGHTSGTSYTQPARTLLNPWSSTFKMDPYIYCI